MVEAQLLAGRTGYDVVMHSARYSARLIPIGIYQPLDRAKLPNWGNLDPGCWSSSTARSRQPLRRALHVGHHRLRLQRENGPRAHAGRAGHQRRDDVRAGSRGALRRLRRHLPRRADRRDPDGAALSRPRPEQPGSGAHRRGREMLKAVRPYIRYFSSTKMLIDLPNEEVCMAMSWSGDYSQAMRRATEVGAESSSPTTRRSEGTLAWFDGVFIPADAPHPRQRAPVPQLPAAPRGDRRDQQ